MAGNCLKVARAIGLECFGIVLMAALIVVWVLGWSNALPVFPENAKVAQAYGSLATALFSIPSTIVTIYLAARSKKKLRALRMKDEERQLLIQHDVRKNADRLEMLRENNEGMFHQLEHAISQNKEILRLLNSADTPIAVVPPPSDFLIKLLLVGDIMTGKTCLNSRWVDKTFSLHYRATIGVDFRLKSVPTTIGNVNLQAWDIAGQERFTNMTKVYYKDASCCAILFDVSKPSTYDNAKKWLANFKDNGPQDAFITFIGNKTDLQWHPDLPSREEIEQELDYPCFFVSAKTGDNVDYTFGMLALASIVKTKLLSHQPLV